MNNYKGWRKCAVENCGARVALHSKHEKCEMHRRLARIGKRRGPQFVRSSPRRG